MEDTEQNRTEFWTAMTRLSTALSTTLSEEQAAVFWDALCDLPLEAVVFACQHAARHWEPREYETLRFPRPAMLRTYAEQYREQRRQHAQRTAAAQLPERTTTIDQEGLAAIHDILAKLDAKMEMRTGGETVEAGASTARQRRARYLRLLGHQLTEEGA